MYAVKTEEDFMWLRYRLERAIRLEQPVTVTYLKQKKDAKGNPIKGKFEITVRTFEPFDLLVSKDGHEYVRSIDRTVEYFRSWRLDRILLYSTSKGIRTLTPELVGASA